ncbi:MAG: transcriptional antiterminator, Rof [Candidatus Thiodiazotropha sp. (ex Ustalcina ferruginea)]|nr:transcriptional antiterminator, Rof [Candidatus Thiodiazotropha sp. (ex Ustalcina ferruginea)]
MANEPYQPISCALHEAFQYAVMRRSLLDLCWRDEDNREHRARALPIDVLTHDEAEFLELELRDGTRQHIRLDQLLKVIVVQGGEHLLG